MRKLIYVLLLSLIGFSSRAIDSVNVSGYALIHFEQYLNEHGRYEVENTGTDFETAGTSSYSAFELTRAYLNFKANLTDNVSVRITTDVATDQDGFKKLYAKYAYVEVRDLIPQAKIRFGLQTPPWGSFIEQNYWRYRMIDKPFFSYWKIFSTADFGLGILGELWDGRINYHLAVLNGEGYKGIEQDRFKEYVGRVSFCIGSKDRFEILPSIGYSTHRWNNSDKFKDDVIMAGLGIDFWRIHLAGEYLQGTYTLPSGEYPLINGRLPDGALDAIKSSAPPDMFLSKYKDINYGGWAVYFNALLPLKLNLFARYDFYDPNFDSDYDNDAQTMWMAGICWHPINNLWISLDYREMLFQENDLDGDGLDELEPIQIIYTHWKIAY